MGGEGDADSAATDGVIVAEDVSIDGETEPVVVCVAFIVAAAAAAVVVVAAAVAAPSVGCGVREIWARKAARPETVVSS